MYLSINPSQTLIGLYIFSGIISRKKIGEGHSFGAPMGVSNDRIVLRGVLNDSPAKPAKILENARKNSDFFDFFLQNFPEVPNFSKNTIKIGAALRAARKIFSGN